VDFFRLTVADGIGTVTMDRPPVNAMNRQFYREMRDMFAGFEDREDIRVVILTSGSSRAFLAGADIKARLDPAEGPRDGHHTTDDLDHQRLARQAFWAVFDCPVPVIAAVDGPALGAGLAVIACCDIVISSPRGTFGLPEINVGLLGGGSFLLRLVGPARMRQALYTGAPISAAEMLERGAIADVVPADQLAQRAHGLAATIAAKSPVAIRLAKASLNRAEWLPLKDAYQLEQDYTQKLRGYPESRQAMLAFVAGDAKK
jgi:enoyl-CoA hydratase